jgi:hypothetical protein
MIPIATIIVFSCVAMRFYDVPIFAARAAPFNG